MSAKWKASDHPSPPAAAPLAVQSTWHMECGRFGRKQPPCRDLRGPGAAHVQHTHLTHQDTQCPCSSSPGRARPTTSSGLCCSPHKHAHTNFLLSMVLIPHQIELVLHQLWPVAAHIQHHGQRVLRVKAAARHIERHFSDRNANACTMPMDWRAHGSEGEMSATPNIDLKALPSLAHRLCPGLPVPGCASRRSPQ